MKKIIKDLAWEFFIHGKNDMKAYEFLKTFDKAFDIMIIKMKFEKQLEEDEN